MTINQMMSNCTLIRMPVRQPLVASLTLICVLLTSSPSGAVEINVADYGITPGKDVTYAVLKLIESVRDQDDVTLVFPKGKYDFHPENAIEQYRAVANHDNGLKRFGFPLFSSDNITIDGGGATFMFHGRLVPITIDACNKVTLKNFTIDCVRPFHAELKVVETDLKKRSFVVEIDKDQHPYVITKGKILFERFGQQDPIGSNIVFDPQTKAPIFNTRNYNINSNRAKATKVGDNRVRIESGVKVPPPVGSVVVVYGVHPTSRLCPAIHVTNSADINLKDVTVLAAGGMGLIVERTENLSLDHMVVTSKAGRFAATRADATHFIGCKGTIKVENCLFEHMLDDSINVHGAYVKVVKSLGKHQLLCEISHFQQWGMTFATAGDRVALLSRETILPFAQSTVKDVAIVNQHRFVVTFSEPLPKLPEGPLSLENLTWNPDLIMRKNIVRQNRARSVLVTTKGNVMIDDNYFSSQMHGILIEGDNNRWYESGAVKDVTISNNTFENIGFKGGPAYPLLASPLLKADQRTGEGQYHRNIRFVGNKIKSFNGLIAQAKSVEGLVIENNTIEYSSDYPAITDIPSIDLNYCKNVTIKNNTAVNFDASLEITKSDDTTGVQCESNTAIEEK